MGTLDPTFANADTDLDVEPILASLAPLEPKIIGLAAEANRYGADRLSLDRQSLLQLHRQFSALSFALIIGGLCLVGALTWHNRLLTRAHRELSNATADLKRTAEDLAAANLTIETANSELRRKNERLNEKEQALQAQNVLFDAALNHMSQGLCMFDSALRPIVCNRRFAELFQLDRFLAPEANGPGPHLRRSMIFPRSRRRDRAQHPRRAGRLFRDGARRRPHRCGRAGAHGRRLLGGDLRGRDGAAPGAGAHCAHGSP